MASNYASSVLYRFRPFKIRLGAIALCAATQAFAQASPPTEKTGSEPTTPVLTAEKCVGAHRESQTLRQQYRLLESRDRLLECSNTACPTPVRKDCLRWLDEVAIQISSVVVHVDTGDSSPPNNVKVYIDGDLRFESIPSRAIELNPGTYTFRFEVHGRQPIELQVTVAEAEKFKNVTVKYSPPEKSSGSGVSQDNSTQQPISVNFVTPTKVPARPVPTATYIFAGLGAAAAVNFAIWGLWTQSLKSDLEAKCAPDCAQNYIDRVKTRALVADISLGVSVASLATAAITYFARPDAKPPMDVALGPLPHGGFIGQVRFWDF